MKSIIFFLLFSASLNAQNLVPYQVQDLKNWDEKGLWGYKDLNFKIVIEPINEEPNLFDFGYAILKKDNKYGVIDSTGKIIFEPTFKKIRDIVVDFARVNDSTDFESDEYIISLKTKQKFGDKKKNINDRIELSNTPNIFIIFSDNATYKSDYGLLLSDGKIILKPEYSFIYSIDDELFLVTDKSGKTGIFNKNGNWVFKPKFKDAGYFENGLASFKENGKYGYFDATGKIIVQPIYKEVSFIASKGYHSVIDDKDESFFIDTKGQIYFRGLGIKEILDVTDNLFTVRAKNDSLYLVNKKGYTINKVGADDIAIIDSTAFLYRIGTKIIYQSADTLIEFTEKIFTKIYGLNFGYYFLNYKTDSNIVGHSIVDINLKTVAEVEIENAFFGWNRNMKIFGKYLKGIGLEGDHLMTYFDKTGKQFSDFKE